VLKERKAVASKHDILVLRLAHTCPAGRSQWIDLLSVAVPA
jgi:hypothetical protein